MTAVIGGCAGTPPQPKFSRPLVAGARVSASDAAHAVTGQQQPAEQKSAATKSSG